jgi:hypothetical protein
MGAVVKWCRIAATSVFLIGCEGTSLEIVTSSSVPVYARPGRPDRDANSVVGHLPPGVTLEVDKQILGKDYAAYKVHFEGPDGQVKNGYVLLGTPGLDVQAQE